MALRDLLFQALESPRDKDGNPKPIRALFPNYPSAFSARTELYKLRARMRKTSKKNLDPSDPNYNTSPFDHLNFYLDPPSDKSTPTTLIIMEDGINRNNFTILDDDDPTLFLLHLAPKRFSHQNPRPKKPTTHIPPSLKKRKRNPPPESENSA